MNNREEIRADILEKLGAAWDEFPDLSFGRLLLEVLQPEERIPELKRLDDEWLLTCLGFCLSAAEQRRRAFEEPGGQ